jgi:hypothetical protein
MKIPKTWRSRYPFYFDGGGVDDVNSSLGSCDSIA